MRYNELTENTQPDDELFGSDRKIISTGGSYAEAVARAIQPGLRTTPWTRASEDAILNAAFTLVKRDTGNTKRAQGIFRDDDFLSDILSYYGELEDGRAYSNGVNEEESDEELFGPNDDRQIAADIAQCVEWMIDKIQDDEFEVEDPQESLAELGEVYKAFAYGTLKTGFASLDNVTDQNVLQELDVDMYHHFKHSLGELEDRFNDNGMHESTDDDLFGQPPAPDARSAPFTQHKPIGTARIDRDIANTWDWEEEFEIDDISDLDYHDRKFIQSAGKTFPVVNINARNQLTILLAPGQPVTMPVEFFEEVNLDSTVDEDLEADDDMFGQGNILDQIKRLLKAKQVVVSRMMGAMGIIYDVTDNGALGLKPANKPYSKMRYSWGPLSPDKLRDFYLKHNQTTGRWELHSREQDAALARHSQD